MKLINVSSKGQNSCQFNVKIPNIDIPPESSIALLKGRVSRSGEINIDETNNTFVVQYGSHSCLPAVVNGPETIKYMKTEVFKMRHGNYKIYGSANDVRNTLSLAMVEAMNLSAFQWFGYNARYSNTDNRIISILTWIKARLCQTFPLEIEQVPLNVIDPVKDYITYNGALGTSIEFSDKMNFVASVNAHPLPYDSRDHTQGGAGNWGAFPLLEFTLPIINDVGTHFKGACMGLLTEQQWIESNYDYDYFKYNRKTATQISAITPLRINVSAQGIVSVQLYSINEDGIPENQISNHSFGNANRLEDGKRMKISVQPQMKSDFGFQFKIVLTIFENNVGTPVDHDVFVPNNWIDHYQFYSMAGLWQTEDDSYISTLRGVDNGNLIDDYTQRIGFIDQIGTSPDYNNQDLGITGRVWFFNKISALDEYFSYVNPAQVFYKVGNDLSELTEQCNVDWLQNRDINDDKDRNFTINDASPNLQLFIDNAYSLNTLYNININNLQLESYIGEDQ